MHKPIGEILAKIPESQTGIELLAKQYTDIILVLLLKLIA